MNVVDLSEKEIHYLARLLVLNFADHEVDFLVSDYNRTNSNNQSLVNKLMFKPGFFEAYKNVLSEKYSSKDNEFSDRRLFLGSGIYSLMDINKLHKRLQFAISELGGEQQNGGMGYEYDEQSGKEAKQNIKDVLRDIIHAFGYEPGDL